jgi:hypothetical protein
MQPSVTTRAATEQDDAFLFALFQAVRLPAFAHVPLAPAQPGMRTPRFTSTSGITASSAPVSPKCLPRGTSAAVLQ